MRDLTQKERVWKKLREDGHIDNVWAFEHHMLRLGAIIKNLRNEGKEIDGAYIPGTKNYRYTIELDKQPRRITGYEKVIKDGVMMARPVFGSYLKPTI